MTMPGFNAETSLYKTSVNYRLTAALVQAGGLMLQQLPGLFPIPIGCLPHCSCVSPQQFPNVGLLSCIGVDCHVRLEGTCWRGLAAPVASSERS
jgi:hypothetical protein